MDATNRGDSVGFLDCFAPDAIPVDWGRRFVGREGIADWDRTDNIGVQARLRILQLQVEGTGFRAQVDVRGNGPNGIGEMVFTLAGGKLQTLVIM